MFRAQEMSRYVEDGVIDVGLTGHDWIHENGSDVARGRRAGLLQGTSQPARWVLAVPEESHRPKGRGPRRRHHRHRTGQRHQNATSPHKGINVKVEFSWGATEVKARLLDGIVDVTETGSLHQGQQAAHHRHAPDLHHPPDRQQARLGRPWKREKIENIALLLKGAIDAREKVGLKMNVPKDYLAAIIALLPAEKSPTVSSLADGDWVAVEVIVEERSERDLIPQLKRAGATGIITYPLNKVIPE